MAQSWRFGDTHIEFDGKGISITRGRFTDSVDVYDTLLDVSKALPVATKAELLALPASKRVLTIKVAVDESKGDQTNTIYQIWPDGSRVWGAWVDDNA